MSSTDTLQAGTAKIVRIISREPIRTTNTTKGNGYRIVALEGLDGPGKSILGEKLLAQLGGQAYLIRHVCGKNIENPQQFYREYNQTVITEIK